MPKRKPRHEKPDKPLAPLTWMRRLKRVFAIDIKTCPKCTGTPCVIARIENPDVIATILERVGAREAAATALLGRDGKVLRKTRLKGPRHLLSVTSI